MFWMNWIRSLDDLKTLNPNAVFPGDPEPAWLRREAEYARELPLLRAERADKPADELRPGLFERFWLAISRD
jgi:hypothetical protein